MSNKSPKGANRISGRDIVRRVSSFLLKTPKPEAETLNIDAEGIINTEKASRVLHMPVMLKNRLKSPKFFEHFLVIGYNNSAHDSSTPQSDGVILYKYPPNSELVVGNIASFCFPCGVSSSGNPTADFLAKQAENEEDDPMGNIKTYHYKNQQNSFLFLQTNAKKEIFYGVCVIDSNLKTFPGFIECDDKTQYSEKKAFVFITQQPAFSLFFDVIYQILLQTEQSSLCSSTDIKEQIPTILSSFYSAALPKPGSQFRVPLLPTVGGFVRPLHSDDEYYLADYSIPILFHVFKKRQILWLLSAILLERKILFICKNVRMLSSVVLSFVPLLRPFEYQSVVVPVLPERMDMVIEAPVPFLIGLPRGPNASSLNVPKDVILVNVDEKKITVTGGLSSVPELPRQATMYPNKTPTFFFTFFPFCFA